MFKTSAVSQLLCVLALATIVVGSTAGYLILQPTGEPLGAGSWLTGWAYRKSHVINAATGAGTLYQVKVTVHYTGTGGSGADVYLNSHCRTDFGDVRFTKSDGATLLDYWMESYTASTSAVFWVEVADDLSTNPVTVYLYYGKGDATTTSSGANTFIEWKNMETDPFTTYVTGDGATHQIKTTQVKEGTYSVYHDQHDQGQIGFSTSVGSTKKIIEFWYYKITPTSRDTTVTFHLTNNLGTTLGGALIYYSETGTTSWYDGTGHSGTGTFATNQWHLFTIVVDTNNNFFKLWVDGTLSISSGTCYSKVPTDYFGMVNTAGTGNVPDYVIQGYIDAWRVRKYVDPEPSHGSWGSEETPNNPPYAPTLNTPAVGHRFNPSSSVTFTWAFSDPDMGDFQTAYQFQLDNDNDFSSPIIDTGKTTAFGWLLGWQKRVKFTTNAGDIDADLTNFPFLLYLSTSSGYNADDVSFIFDALQSDANRLKIAVTTSDGTSQCYVEIEKWDDVNEKAWLWVKAPSVSGTVDTDFYLYYDNTHADNTAYVGDPESTPAMNVWDANFKAVYHMRDKTTSSIADSTTNNYDGTKIAVNKPTVTTLGKIDDAQDFNGADAYVNCGTGLNVGTGAFTLEVWFKPDVLTSYRHPIDKRLATSPYTGYVLFTYLTKAYMREEGTGGTQIVGTTVLSVGSWYHIVGFRSTEPKLYLFVNGAQDATPITAGGINLGNTNNLKLGGHHQDNAAYLFDGIIDEVRISNIARSVAWIKATYETGRDHLLDWGSEETFSSNQYTVQTLPSIVGLYYWRVKTWDGKDAEGPYCTERTIIVDRIKITTCSILNGIVDTRTGGSVYYQAVYESDSTPFTGSAGTLYLNDTAMVWAIDRWTYAFPYNMSGNQAIFHITSVTESTYGLTVINNVAGDLVLNWATMEITINKP